MAQLFTNNAVAILATSISAIDTSIVVGGGFGALFPFPLDADDFFLITLEDTLSPSSREIVRIESRSGDTLTVATGGRGYEGTTASAWTATDTLVDHRVTAGTLRQLQHEPAADNPTSYIEPTATGDNSFAWGDSAAATHTGEIAHASGRFAVNGDAQQFFSVLRTQTTDATLTEMFLDGTGGTDRLTLPDDSTWIFEALVVGRRTDANDEGAGYRLIGVIDRNVGAASTALIGNVSRTTVSEDNGPWQATIDADTTNGSLRVRVTGQAAKTIRWVSRINIVQVTG